MQKGIYSVYDKQAEIHGPPFFAINDTLAKRAFEQVAANPESDVNKYPQDYKLVKLGTLNTVSGEIVSKIEQVPS